MCEKGTSLRLVGLSSVIKVIFRDVRMFLNGNVKKVKNSPTPRGIPVLGTPLNTPGITLESKGNSPECHRNPLQKAHVHKRLSFPKSSLLLIKNCHHLISHLSDRLGHYPGYSPRVGPSFCTEYPS